MEKNNFKLKNKKICIVATSGISLLNFRGELIKSWIKKGNEVLCISIESPEEISKIIDQIGAKYYQVAGDRTSIGILSGLKMIKEYKKIFKKYKPDICYLYMSKPVAFGGIAAIQTKVPHINVLVNGLENAYYRRGLKDFIVRCVMSCLYFNVARKADNVFFQNTDDMMYFKKHHLLSKENANIINGSGVDMQYFYKAKLPEKPAALMVARLLWSKGIREYLQAIKIVKEKYPEFRFILIGGLDKNDEALTKEELEDVIKETNLEYYGYAEDVRPYIEEASIFVLPSYHEGLSRSILEAMAMGRVVITTDAPGCKDTILDKENGFIVPVKNSKLIAEKIIYLIENPKEIERMSENSYSICLEKFEVNKVNNEIIKYMEEKL